MSKSKKKAKAAGPKKLTPKKHKSESKKSKAPKEAKPKKLSMKEAAVLILKDAKDAMNVKQIVEKLSSYGYQLGAGKTPENSLSSRLREEIGKGYKGGDSRIKLTERGLFVAV